MSEFFRRAKGANKEIMAQVVEAKLRKRSKSDKHFEWAKSELDANENGYEKKKLDVICELAPRLEEEGEIETNKISTEIAKRLRKYVTQRYVNKVLDKRYKDEIHAEIAKSRRTSSAKTKRAALTADVSEANIISTYEPLQKQGAPRKSAENNKLNAIILDNSELKEALKRQTTLLSADQVSANEITFNVPKEKFNQLKKAMEISRDSIRLVFDKSGMLERAEPDAISTGIVNKKTIKNERNF
jgi:hypothetical protein